MNQDQIANKVWHFRELYDIEGSEDSDQSIASDLFYRGVRHPRQLVRALKDLYQTELQAKLLVEEAERIKSTGGSY